MTWPTATRKDHESFCHVERWTRVRDARGRTGTHHVTYRLVLHDGRTLRTRVSHPVDRTDYGPRLWAHVLRDQLEVDDRAFWSCVRDGVLPDRGAPASPPDALPAELVFLLITRVGVPEAEVAAMSRAEAAARLDAFWADGS